MIRYAADGRKETEVIHELPFYRHECSALLLCCCCYAAAALLLRLHRRRKGNEEQVFYHVPLHVRQGCMKEEGD